jgi:hypothetical protein
LFYQGIIVGHDRFGDGRLRGLRGQHLRWDVALGIQKPACKFCYPDVSGPVVPLEPLASAMRLAPVPVYSFGVRIPLEAR